MAAQTLGIDFATARPNPQAVYAAGYRIVLGYLSYNAGKNLTGPQVAAYRAAGLQVGLVWETTADRALGGYSAGASDGAAAEAQANTVLYPPGCVLFAAVDFGATLAQIDGPIRAYFQGFNSATRRPVGVYGSYDVVSRLCTPGQAPVQYAWQTMAWSSGRIWQPAHLFQRLAHSHNIAGSQITDWDENVLLNPLPLMGSSAPAPGPSTGGTVPTLDQQDLLNLYETVWFGAPGGTLIPQEREGGGAWPVTVLGSLTARIARDIVTPALAPLNAAVASLAGLVAQGHADMTKDDILKTVNDAIQAAVVKVDVNVSQPAQPAPPA